jgi:heme A synthase
VTPAAIVMLGVVLFVIELGIAAYLLDVPALWIVMLALIAIAAAALIVARRLTRHTPNEKVAESSGDNDS